MKLTKKDIFFILILPISAIIMSFEFGGNYRTFYEWLGGEVGFSGSVPLSDEVFMIISWIYAITLLGTVIFEVIHNADYMKLFACVNFGAVALCMIFGIVDGGGDAICIGMILMFIISIGMLLTCVRKKAESR